MRDNVFSVWRRLTFAQEQHLFKLANTMLDAITEQTEIFSLILKGILYASHKKYNDNF